MYSGVKSGELLHCCNAVAWIVQWIAGSHASACVYDLSCRETLCQCVEPMTKPMFPVVIWHALCFFVGTFSWTNSRLLCFFDARLVPICSCAYGHMGMGGMACPKRIIANNIAILFILCGYFPTADNILNADLQMCATRQILLEYLCVLHTHGISVYLYPYIGSC